ncbi:hypothetical protein C0991_007429 [Blastosporella zonata]|nr:hypothetical protein C0991_007429 [Blastosporella zonata]
MALPTITADAVTRALGTPQERQAANAQAIANALVPINQSIDEIKTRLGTVETVLGTMDTRLGTIETNITSIKDNMAAVKRLSALTYNLTCVAPLMALEIVPFLDGADPTVGVDPLPQLKTYTDICDLSHDELLRYYRGYFQRRSIARPPPIPHTIEQLRLGVARAVGCPYAM